MTVRSENDFVKKVWILMGKEKDLKHYIQRQKKSAWRSVLLGQKLTFIMSVQVMAPHANSKLNNSAVEECTVGEGNSEMLFFSILYWIIQR